MPEASSPRAGRYVVFFLIAFLLLVADQLTKFWIRENLAIGQSLWSWEYLR